MMCSTWKISVFGIVALMLSFGLVAGDAFAHSDRHTSHPAAPNAVNHFDDATLTVVVNSSVTPPPPALPAANGNGGGIMRRDGTSLLNTPDGEKLRATEVLDSIVFTYTPGITSSVGNVILTIPGGWTEPVQDNDDGIHEDGEVTINSGSVSIGSGGGGWRISSANYDPAPAAQIIITYKRVTVPKRAGAYQFGFTSNVIGAGHVSQLDYHLNGHAVEVGEMEGGHTHGDVGSIDSVQAHSDHSSATWTISLPIHEHTNGDITRTPAHVHRLTETTADPASTTEVHKPKNHAHDGDGGAVVTVYGHTHDGHNEMAEVGSEHDHAGSNQGVSTASLHSHEAGGVLSSVVFHTHPSASADNAAIPVHSHPTAAMDNPAVLTHAHPGTVTAFSTQLKLPVLPWGRMNTQGSVEASLQCPHHYHSDADDIPSSSCGHKYWARPCAYQRGRRKTWGGARPYTRADDHHQHRCGHSRHDCNAYAPVKDGGAAIATPARVRRHRTEVTAIGRHVHSVADRKCRVQSGFIPTLTARHPGRQPASHTCGHLSSGHRSGSSGTRSTPTSHEVGGYIAPSILHEHVFHQPDGHSIRLSTAKRRTQA